MDHIPSQSISKSILIVTPLFLLVLAVLHSSSQLSYLFILKFINNAAGSADITFLPTTQPEISHLEFSKDNTMKEFWLNPEGQGAQTMPIPLINITEQQKWVDKNDIILGTSPRWLIPTKIGSTDSILLILNVSRETEIGIIGKGNIPNLDARQIAMQKALVSKLGYSIGDTVPIKLQPKNMLGGLKLFDKFRDLSSDEEYKPESEEFKPQQMASKLFQLIQARANVTLNQSDFEKLFNILYESEVNVKYTLKRGFYPEGVYPSAISNVIVMEYSGFINLLSQWIVNTLVKVADSEEVDIKQYIPLEYRGLIPKNQIEAQASGIIAKQQLKVLFKNWALTSVCRLNRREEVYNPYQGQTYQIFATTLESLPGSMEVVVVYPFFKQSLAIKFFFDSIIQIFEFVTCIIYFYTITLIMKQVYEQKQVEVGIWRTLGAGGVSQRKSNQLEVQMQDKPIFSRGSGVKYSSQFEEQMTWKQRLNFISRLAIKVGFAYYWLATTFASVVLYFILKLIIYKIICSKLGFDTIYQPISNLFVIFILVLIFIQVLVYQHIRRIYTNSLSETIKPVKRTFDVVKVRVIHIATFGVTLEVLLIAIMLIYYGVVSYYWIPFAVLDGQEDLQVLLFNTIFLFMIFGSIILLSILQSRLQIAVFKIIFKFNAQMRSMKLAILKNIKAKQYKNIKVAIIISIIFAFVLFFTAGIKIQIQIIQSFIQRALGSSLVFENYEKKTFKTQPINEYLDTQQAVQYSWLSRSLSRDNVTITLISHISGDKLTPEFQVLTPAYLNSTFYQYYYPENYLPDHKDYWQLPNSVYDGFNSIYTGQNGQESVGKFNPNDTIQNVDPNKISVNRRSNEVIRGYIDSEMAPEEQVINLVVSTSLRKKLGVRVGDYYKMKVQNILQELSFYLRARITHSFKAGPGFDLLGSKAFISQQQAAYIYRILNIDKNEVTKNQKLFIKGSPQSLKGLSSAIIPMSPQHTQMFEVEFVSQSFLLLQKYLDAYVILITCIMSVLVTIFIFLYTLGKCREEAEMYKMLRAIGLSAKNIRMMVFFEIMIRLVISVINGIALGVMFSMGFSMQIQEFLMIKTPAMDITIVSVIGVVLILVFSVTIIRATRYIAHRTVAETNKI